MAARLRAVCKCMLLMFMGTWLLLLGAWWEPRDLRIEYTQVAVPGWPEDAAPVRAVVLGDIHAARWDAAWVDYLVKLTTELKPEVIFLTGDFCFTGGDRHFYMKPQEVAKRLAPLAECCPVYFVMGNHDYFLDLMRISRDLQQVGFRSLVSRDVVHRFANGQELQLRGGSFVPERSGKECLPRRLVHWKRTPLSRPLLVLIHNPYHFQKWSLVGDIVIAGHTHGGQICLPDMRPFRPSGPVTPAMQRGGWHRAANGAPLYINRGIGMTKIPLRFNCPPEITVLTLCGKGD